MFGLAFWLGSTDTVARQIWDLLATFSLYPEPLFGGVLRLLLFTILPAGFVGYVPALLQRETTPGLAFGLMAAALAYPVLAGIVFQRGLRRYGSGSRFGSFG